MVALQSLQSLVYFAIQRIAGNSGEVIDFGTSTELELRLRLSHPR